MSDVYELSRPVRLRSLPADPVVIEADEAERAALAERFGIPAVTSLRAEVDVERRAKAVHIIGSLDAEIVQECAVAGDEFTSAIREDIALRFVPEGAPPPANEEGEIVVELDADALDELTYSGDTIDIGEAVAQTLALAIDPYAEGPNADAARAKAGIAREGEHAGPLAEMLKGLRSDG